MVKAAVPCCCIRTVLSSLRVVSTVTTTARWGGTITPTWPYLPATGCSKWAAESCAILDVLRISLDIFICSPSLPLTHYRLASIFFSSLSAWQWDVWWWSPCVSNWALTSNPFNCKLFLLQRAAKHVGEISWHLSVWGMCDTCTRFYSQGYPDFFFHVFKGIKQLKCVIWVLDIAYVVSFYWVAYKRSDLLR